MQAVQGRSAESWADEGVKGVVMTSCKHNCLLLEIGKNQRIPI